MLNKVLKFSKRHLAKTISWRIIGTFDTMILSAIITGSWQLGLTIGGLEVITKMILYYFHERVWYNSSLINPNHRHIIKTFTWRGLGTLDTVLISFLLTGDAVLGLQIGVVETVSKMVLYYVHEKLWYRINFGLDR
tara:strand:+ start:1952 stop:2359 length:408 start_codon:yes stop_codon:yes gene_type:complete